jgi:hypothetical protein
MPSLVARPKHDFGQVTQGDTLRHAFALRNVTGSVLTVDDTIEVLGCSGVPAPSVLEVGGGGQLEVTCRPMTHGPLRVSLPFRANGLPAGELTLTASVEPLAAFDRAVVDLTFPFGEERRAEVRLRGTLAKKVQLTPVAPAPPGLEMKVLPAEAGKSEGVALRATGNTVGTHVGSLRFATGLPMPSEIAFSYVVKVFGTLEVAPTNPVLDLAAPGGTRSTLHVKSTQPGFQVTGAEVMDGPFATKIRRAGTGYEVEVTFVLEKLHPGTRGVNGRIKILSNDRTEPRKEVPLFALGRPPGLAQRP